MTAWLHLGDEGNYSVSDHDHLIDVRAVLRQAPPDILLSNYANIASSA